MIEGNLTPSNNPRVSEFLETQSYELSSLRSLTSPEGLTGPMALRNPACPCVTRKRALAPWPGRPIDPLSPLKGAYPLQTTPKFQNILEIPKRQVSSIYSMTSKGLSPLWPISVLRQLLPKSCYPLDESTPFPPNPLMAGLEPVEIPSRGGHPTQGYNQGNRYFQDGQYEKAIESYEEALRSGVENGNLFYNLGNSYYKDGQIGKAIWAYEKAKAFSPRDGDVTFNLQLLRSLLEDKPEVSSGGMIKLFIQLPGFFTLDELSWGESLLYLLLTLSIIVYLLSFKPGLRRTMKYLFAIFVPLFLICLLLFAARLYELNFKERAIILSRQLDARSGPGDDYTRILTLHEGIEVEIKQSREGWCLIKLPNGLGGWIEEGSLLRI